MDYLRLISFTFQAYTLPHTLSEEKKGLSNYSQQGRWIGNPFSRCLQIFCLKVQNFDNGIQQTSTISTTAIFPSCQLMFSTFQPVFCINLRIFRMKGIFHTFDQRKRRYRMFHYIDQIICRKVGGLVTLTVANYKYFVCQNQYGLLFTYKRF